MKYRNRQSGSAIIIILIAVALFAALMYTFMRGSQQGQGNLTAQQAKIAAQELINFFGVVERATNKLRAQGCSENDISFVNSGDTNGFNVHNVSPSAPVDKTCHVFDQNGGKVNFNMDWKKYQIASIAAPNTAQHGNLYFRMLTYSIVDVGTSANDYMVHFNFIKPEICDAYNRILGLTISTANDASPVFGDENATYRGHTTFCRATSSFNQIFFVWLAR